MELLLLSGNSVHTREWIEAVERELKPLFSSTYIHYYNHWKTGEKIIDLNYESDKLSTYLKDKQRYVIFGKSAGAVLALKCIFERKIDPTCCMFVGIPIHWCDSMNLPIRKWINNFKTQSYFIQKTNDPMINFKHLTILLEEQKVKNAKVIEIMGEDHHYENIIELKKCMKNLIRGE